MDCPICCLHFTPVIRRELKCPFCAYNPCLICFKKYLLTSYNDPSCMNCHTLLSDDYIDTTVSRSFRTKDYKIHRQNILIEREKSFLPATVPLVERINASNELKKEIGELSLKLWRYANDKIDNQEVREMRALIKNKRQELRDIESASVKKTPCTFTRACVMSGCRGFLNSSWKCGVCSTWVCDKCHETKNEEKDPSHKCDPNNILTVKMLARDTKPCPKCASMIHKVSGCDLMFCTMCHVSFSWNTGQEVYTAYNHNPHYFEYIRQMNKGDIPRAPGDIPMPCGGLPYITTVYNFIDKFGNHDIRIKYIDELLRIIMDIQHYQLNQNLTYNFASNEDLRVRYLTGKISDDDWKTLLFQKEDRKRSRMAHRAVFEMLVTVSGELFNRLVNTTETKKMTEILDELETALNYFNEEIVKVAKRYGKRAKTFDFNKFTKFWTYAVERL